jgi:hypothetical protein
MLTIGRLPRADASHVRFSAGDAGTIGREFLDAADHAEGQDPTQN